MFDPRTASLLIDKDGDICPEARWLIRQALVKLPNLPIGLGVALGEILSGFVSAA